MAHRGWSRRKFVKTALIGVLGGCMSLEAGLSFAQRMGGGGGMGGSGGIINPPPGAAFANPAAMPVSRTRELVEGFWRDVVNVSLEAKKAAVKINGATANLMTYNGLFPGPTITVRKNDIVRINFTNSLPYTTQTNLLGYQKNITNLHTHGWHVSPEPPADYVMYDLKPGQTYNHQYDLAKQEAGSFNFYHPHKHGVSAEQYWAGLAGCLITEDELPVFQGMDTKIMVLKDIALSGSEPAPHSMMSDYMHGKSGATIMVNGLVNPVVSVRPTEVPRWRLLNASNVRHYLLSLEVNML